MDLIVEENTTLELDAENPVASLASAAKREQINSLSDLVRLDFVSKADLAKMLEAGKETTQEALANMGSRPPLVAGTRRPDLGRFSGYVNRLAELNPVETKLVWNLMRKVEPARMAALKVDHSLQISPSHRWWGQFFFKDITVKSGGSLIVKSTTRLLQVHDLVIEHNARIIVEGSTLSIRANSIRGF